MTSVLQTLRLIKGLDPVANAFAGTVRSDIINMSHFEEIAFIIYKGVGTTGTSTVTVVASDDNSPSNETAVEFVYQRGNNPDVPGALTKAPTTGFVTTAGSSDAYMIIVKNQALASSGYKFVHLKMVESAASAVLGTILILGRPKYYPSTNTITS
jgi:hypothetical protein